MHWTAVRWLRQTGLTAADRVWYDKETTACSLTASVVNYLYFAVTASIVNGDGYCRKLFEMTIYRVFCIFCLKIHCQKYLLQTVVIAIGMWGYTPVGLTGVLVIIINKYDYKVL